MGVKFSVVEKESYSLVEFEIEGGIITPDELRELQAPSVNPQKGVVLSGRGPVWLYGFLTHEYHATRWVATYDPRLGGGVVVATHDPSKKVGDIVPVEG